VALWINNSEHPKRKRVTSVLHLDATFRIDPYLLYCEHFMDPYSDQEQNTFDTGPDHCKIYMKLSQSTKRRELSSMSLATFLTRHPSTCINMSQSTKLKMLTFVHFISDTYVFSCVFHFTDHYVFLSLNRLILLCLRTSRRTNTSTPSRS